MAAKDEGYFWKSVAEYTIQTEKKPKALTSVINSLIIPTHFKETLNGTMGYAKHLNQPLVILFTDRPAADKQKFSGKLIEWL
ncbi:hypothetical protein GIX45_10665 [Erwinia sp. CPCC 100877]|nr:hypothetical protein [Erwinia sp. CPCC 100877]